MRIGALASGAGTILESLLGADLPIAVVVVDRHCGAEQIAEAAGVPVEAVVRSDFSAGFDREGYSERLVEVLERHDVDLLVMAGFGTIVGKPLHVAYPDRILNTHPALLPAFKGWHAVADALAYGVKVTGCTVHVAALEVDEGLILAQEAVRIESDDTVETLHERIKMVERRLYPATVHEVVARLEKGEQLS